MDSHHHEPRNLLPLIDLDFLQISEPPISMASLSNETDNSKSEICNPKSKHPSNNDILYSDYCEEYSSDFAQSIHSSMRLLSTPSSLSAIEVDDDQNNQPSNSIMNRLDDKCLVKILDELPLQRLIIFRCVCLRWKRVIEKEICPQRTAVKLFRSVKNLKQSIGSLFDSDVEAKLYCRFECLIISSNTSMLQNDFINPFYNFLARVIPKMEKIVFYFAPANSHDILHVFEKWRRSLKFLGFVNMSTDLDWKTIWHKVGLLPMLNHLVINGHWCLRDPSNLSQMKHLKSLTIFNYYLTKLLPAIDKFESNITQLIMCNVGDNTGLEVAFREWVSRKPELQNNLTLLTIDGKQGISENLLKMICTTFAGLTCLDFKFDTQVN